MAITLIEWIIVCVAALAGIGIAVYCFLYEETKYGFIVLAVTLGICLAMMFGLSWYHTNTASGQRSYKDFKSDISGGLNREITITAEDGREIFHYEGKIDIETQNDGYILFESEEGQRYIIYYGVQDTVLIVEKNN